jgi:SPP1 family phage portal protein
MELSELTELLNDPSKLATTLKDLAPAEDEGARKFEPEDHDVNNNQVRKLRVVETPTGILDSEGNETYTTEYEEVNRIASSTQKLIVDWAVQMALGIPVEIQATPKGKAEETMAAMIKKTIKDNKMEYLDQEILRLRCIHKIVMEIWYSEPCQPSYWGALGRPQSKFKMRCMVISPEDGNIIVPIRDIYKDVIGAARFYTVKIEGKDIEKMDLFLADRYITYVQAGSGWELEKETKIKYGKANFIIWEQKRREYQDVESKLNRRETIDSDNADENEASGRPILVAEGDIEAVGKRADTGKTFKVANGGGLKYVEPQGAQEAISKERENLIKDIFDETQTPQISFESTTGMGNMPGISIKLLFLPAMLKAKAKHQGSLGMSHQRRLNFLKAAMAVINTDVKPALDMEISPRFSIFLPENETEKYENIVKLVGAGLLSRKKAVEMLGLVESDKLEEEIEQIEKELKEAQASKVAQQPAPLEKVA